MKQQINQGFTLIEVLIAAVILFSALAITAELYNSSALSSNKVISNSQLSQASIIAVRAIKADLRLKTEQRNVSEHSGTVRVMGIDFQYTAIRESYVSRAMELSDSEPPRKQFSLFLIEVSPTKGDKVSPTFSFKVATW